MTDITKIKNFNSELLDLVMRDPDYYLYYGDAPLKTTGGKEIYHTNERLIKHLLVELSVLKNLEFASINSYITFCIQNDFIEASKDPLVEFINEVIEADFFIQMKIAGAKESQVFDVENMLDFFIENNHILNLIFLGVASVQKAINSYFVREDSHNNLSSDDLREFVKQSYIELSVDKRAVVNTLCIYHDAGLMLPLLLVNNSVTASEYTNALFAFQINRMLNSPDHKTFNQITGSRIADKITYPLWEKPVTSFDMVHKQALDSLEYLSYFTASDKKFSGLMELISRGESYNLEFKSTLRWNIKAERKDPAIEHASLKTVTAFLNSSGGILLIGVQDDGSILGTEFDKFENEDRYLLHLWNLIKSSMGQDVGQFIDITIEHYQGKQLCKIVCSRSSRPVFLRQKGYDEEFYIRLGPSSASLDISEALKYIADRFTPENKQLTK